MTLIGVTGRYHAGKDTIADYLVAEHGYEKWLFAEKLKQSVAALFGLTREQVDDLKGNPDDEIPFGEVILQIQGRTQWSFSWREFLQRYGTESHRDVFGTDFWVEQLFKDELPKNVVICDTRFENEAIAIHRRDGYIVEVRRPSVTSDDEHISEAGLDAQYLDYIIANEGTKEELYGKVDQMMEFFHLHG